MNDYNQAALIVTGPRDGELIVHDRPILEIPELLPPADLTFLHHDPLQPLPIETLTFKRITVAALSFGYLDCYVPVEWTNNGRRFAERMVLSHLLLKAFKGA
jgi:hypothetical protein